MLRMLLAIAIAVSVRAASVEGRVINSLSGVGVPKASIRLHVNHEIQYTTVSDAEGRFQFKDVEPGIYHYICTAGGYNAAPRNRSDGPSVQVTGPDQHVPLEIKLDPMAKLSGRVLDLAGEPVANAEVFLFSSNRLPLGLTKTDSRGEYRFTLPDLSATWRIAAAAPPGLPPPEPGVAWMMSYFAEDVAERPGAERWDINIHLKTAPAHRIQGRVLCADGKPAAGAAVSLTRAGGPGPTLQTKAADDGTFDLTAVVDDDWRLTSQRKVGDITEYAARLVSVKGRDLDEIDLRLNAPFSIAVKIALEVPEGMPAQAPPQADVFLAPADGFPSGLTHPMGLPSGSAANGDMVYHDLYPGLYMINVISQKPSGAYLDTIRLGNRDAFAMNVPILSGAEAITVVYKLGGGNVRGTVDNCGDGDVVLIPTEPARRRPNFLVPSKCGPDGRFEIRSVRPGEYYAMAVTVSDQLRVNEIMASDAALALASRITVRANETTAADLRLVHP
jgi:hypothetical protein